MYDKLSFLKGLALGLAGKPLEFAPGKEPEAPIPDNCLAFASAEPFTIATSNTEKNWDGTLYYSTDADTWSEWDGTTTLASAKHDGEQRIYMRGVGNTRMNYNGETGPYYRRWVMTGSNIRCSGNIETLLDYETVANGEHPSMAEYCYSNMFFRCESLVQAPDLPATTLAAHCYDTMFQYCTSLVQAPGLPATTLAVSCYNHMFGGCDSLVKAPGLPATTLAASCYNYMFAFCTSLVEAPSLPATTLAASCYRDMFNGCSSLVELPSLPATTLAASCYRGMFKNCKAIMLSMEQVGEYDTMYRVPLVGNGTGATQALYQMFDGTGGTFTGEPSINKTYYTSNTVV